jgi:hypothetical protein
VYLSENAHFGGFYPLIEQMFGRRSSTGEALNTLYYSQLHPMSRSMSKSKSKSTSKSTSESNPFIVHAARYLSTLLLAKGTLNGQLNEFVVEHANNLQPILKEYARMYGEVAGMKLLFHLDAEYPLWTIAIRAICGLKTVGK